MSKKLKDIVDDFSEEMANTTETGEELRNKIKTENKSLIEKIINYFMDKFNFLKNKEKK